MVIGITFLFVTLKRQSGDENLHDLIIQDKF